MSLDPVDFLNAALDEAEKTALAAKGDGDGVWERDGIPFLDDSRIEDPSRGRVIVYDEGAPTQEEADHIVRHDPAAVLRRITADRKILVLHTAPHTVGDGFCVEEDGECTRRGEDECTACGQQPCDTVIALAEGWGWGEES